MDISSLSLVELKNLLDLIPAEIKRREKEEKAKLRKDIEALVLSRGFSMDDLIGESSVKEIKEKKPVAIKYRHPQDQSLSWTGRGRQPRWIVDYINNGGALEQLAV